MASGGSLNSFPAVLHDTHGIVVSKSTLYEWRDKHPDFDAAASLGHAKALRLYEAYANYHTTGVVPKDKAKEMRIRPDKGMIIFLLKTRFRRDGYEEKLPIVEASNASMQDSTEKLKKTLERRVSDFVKESKNFEESRLLLYYRCADDFELFCKVFFGHYTYRPFCDMHKSQFKSYSFGERSVRRVDAAPRGYAKSTNKATFRPIHDICYHQEKYIIIASNTEDQSIQKLKDIRQELLDNDLLIAVYGSFFSSSVTGAKSFIAINNGHQTLVQAAGSSKELRGKRFNQYRPTKIVLDDFEHSTEVESETVREKTKRLFYEVFAKLGNEKTNIEVVGTVLHRNSLLNDLLHNPGYERNIYKSIISYADSEDLWEKWKKIYTDLDNANNERDAQLFYESNKTEMLKGTKVLWPEYESYLTLMKEIIIYGRRAFEKEKQNNPLSDDDKIFLPERMRDYVDLGDHLEICHNKVKIRKSEMRVYGAIDPSTGQSPPKVGKKGDFTCILTGYQDDRGRLFVHHDYTKRVPPSRYIQEILNLHEEFSYYLFAVEANLYKNILIQNIRDEKKRRQKTMKNQQRLKLLEIIQKENKIKRIHTVEPKVEHGYIYFNKSLTREFRGQLLDFPSSDAHDDGPDALELLWSIANRPLVGGVAI